MASKDFTDAASDLCAWGQNEGMAVFVIHTTESGNIRYIGPSLPVELVAKMLRTTATAYEAQAPKDRTIQ